MSIFNVFQKKMFYNYILGSLIAVLGVGSVFIFQTLELPAGEYQYMIFTIFLSLITMFLTEYLVYSRHIRPIKAIYKDQQHSLEALERAFNHSLNFPVLTVRRIMLPHFLGLAVPATVLTYLFIHAELLNLPYIYIGYAWAGAFLVATMHALIEFYLTFITAAPLITDLADKAQKLYKIDLFKDKPFYLSLKRKLLAGSLFLALFPVLLFSLASQIRLSITSVSQSDYWSWAGLLILIIVVLALLGTILLFSNIERPVKELQTGFQNIEQGKLKQLKNPYSDEFSDLVNGFNNMVASIQVKDKKNEQLIASFFDVIAGALDARDPYTAGHSKRVAHYSSEIAESAGWAPDKIELLRKSALLHDIGKIGIRDDVLLKEGRLSEEEFAQIKRHPVIGAKILDGIDLTEELLPILPGIKYHHERIDGKGYPEGLSANQIPEFGRLIAVADAYDAMTSDRPYRRGMSPLKALSILQEGKGTQWDADFVEHFISIQQTQIAKTASANR
ncbi:HD domain-containing protein [Rossellomorea vietnamensis]|uniref:HD domain-containing protein n=1 Tax=Rossellomorea vietnamensis TaxID=218284 RepID=A0A5D4MHW2_9BACI|nr:HD domain-containing phosphohydrolase [Rossellomorea vietnamensis]TYS01505.1 HD domain-containing protein [Rossellomorea vietnamensis]